jgi:hypothetical protein
MGSLTRCPHNALTLEDSGEIAADRFAEITLETRPIDDVDRHACGTSKTQIEIGESFQVTPMGARAVREDLNAGRHLPTQDITYLS